MLRKNFISIIIIAGWLLAAGATPQEQEKPYTVGIALSGGAALGLAHIGVLKVLEREGIHVDFISGNSMGALVGGVCAAGYTAAQIESMAYTVNWQELFRSSVPFGAQYLPERQQNQRYALELRHQNFNPMLPSGLVSLQNVEFLLMRILGRIEYNTYYDFDSLPIPYRAVAVDLVSGERVVLDRGQLTRAIRASIAIPGVFSPVRRDGRELVDGGVQQYLPVDPLYDFEPDLIIAVLTMKHHSDNSSSLIDIVSRSMDLVNAEDLWLQRNLADVVIEPDVDQYQHSSFSKVRELIKAGETAAESLMPLIREKLAGHDAMKKKKHVNVRPDPVVRSFRIEGLKITGESMVTRVMRTRINRRLDFDVLRDDLERIYNMGLFEHVGYSVEAAYHDSIDLVIVLEEKPYGFYLLGIHYDNFDNVIFGIEAGQGNIKGSGASLRAALTIGTPNEVRLGITGTRIFTLPLDYRLDGFAGEGENDLAYEENDSTWRVSYDAHYQGGIAEAGYVLGKDAFFNIGIKAVHVRNEFPPLSVFDSLDIDEWIVGPKLKFEYNNLDDLYLPTRGFVYRGGVFFATRQLGSSKGFLKVEAGINRSYPFGRHLVFHAGVDFGMNIFGKPAWSEYFRSGGESFVGFDRAEFTTRHKAIVMIGLDWRLLNLFGRDDYPLYLEVLGNAGSFEKTSTLIDQAGAGNLKWGSGLGIKTNTPVGPVRIVAGLGDRDAASSSLQLRFWISLGKDFRYPR